MKTITLALAPVLILFSTALKERFVAMRVPLAIQKGLAILVLLGIVFSAYWLIARPYQLHWGATASEIASAMPGDELDASPTFLATRAITIHATPEQIWPWLLQMGYGRAGFYGYDIIENMGSPRGIESANQILPDLQHFQVGDPVPISGVATTKFYAIQGEKYLIWSGLAENEPGGFTWALYPIDGENTRLVSRIRWSYHPVTQPGALALDLFTEFTDHLAVRKVLQGVQGRVEGHPESAWSVNLEFFLHVLTALLFFVGLIFILVRPLSWNTWLLGLATGAIWLLSWYGPFSIQRLFSQV